jgi:hypothetical protein
MDKNVTHFLPGLRSTRKGTKIYDFIKGWYRWNEVYGNTASLE